MTAIATGAAAPAPPRHERVVLLARNEPVQSVLLRLARETGTSISVAPGVTGYVTVSLRGVTLAQALAAVLAPLGDRYRLRGNVYDVEPPAAAGTAPALAVAITPAVLPVAVVPVHRAAVQLRALFPQASVREDARSNALLVVAPPADLQAMRTVLQGIDVRNPTDATTEAIGLRTVRADAVVPQLHGSFPKARIAVVGTKQLLVTALPQDLAQIRAALAALDAPVATPAPAAVGSEAMRVTQRRPADVARALSRQVAGLHAAVSGSAVVLSGPPDAVARAKALVAQLDVPAFGARYTQVYRIKSLDAGSVADLLRRSFRDAEVTVDAAINALAVTATAAEQQRIADAVGQLDPAPGAGAGIPGTASFAAGSSTELVTLKSAVPGQTAGGPDAVSAITQALQAVAPDVRVVQLPTPGQLALVGSPPSVRAAREFIDKVDVIAPQVVLDTEVLELDESTAKNLGVQLGTAVLSTTYTESTPPPDANGSTPRLGRLQGFARTPLSFTAQLNLAISNGHGRVLADPRITTLSGRTASIRAGDTLSILTTTSGNAGTIATTQVQSFQTGVTLDITPLVDSAGGVTVALHPVVNSLVGVSASGVPEISTRDTQTTVHLQNNETLVIGGLIQENETRTTSKIPLLGDLPLVGRVFRNDNTNSSRNELIIVVTPHIVTPGSAVLPGPPIRSIPAPQPLPTLPPNATLPAPLGQLPRPQLAPAMARPATAAPLYAPTPAPSTAPLGAPPPASAPAPAPTAFAQTNVFTFGSAPQSNFAKSGDPVQIFYASLSPTIVANGTAVKLAAITTTNASSVKLVVGTQTFGLAQTGPGQWQTAFPFPLAAVPGGQTSVNLSLVAGRPDGTSSTVAIPVNVNGGN